MNREQQVMEDSYLNPEDGGSKVLQNVGILP